MEGSDVDKTNILYALQLMTPECYRSRRIGLASLCQGSEDRSPKRTFAAAGERACIYNNIVQTDQQADVQYYTTNLQAAITSPQPSLVP